MIETGRYITCKSGVYVTKVVDRKVSCGKTILILKNTLNGFCRPSFEQMFTRCGGTDTAAIEPLFTRNGAFQFATLKDNIETEVVTIFGNLCTGNDIVATDIELPYLSCGDIVIINNAGSYAAVISPMQFSSQEGPAEIFLPIF
jgi:diaminopimelate decarboxylase